MPLSMVWNKPFCLTVLFVLFFSIVLYSADTKYVIVYFIDKDLSSENWSQLFSSSSIDRRLRQDLEFDFNDYPVQEKYLQQLLDSGFQVINTSRWLNAALVVLPVSFQNALNQLCNFNFVQSVSPLGGNSKVEGFDSLLDFNEEVSILNSISKQTIGLDTLHQEGFLGEGVTIGIIDAGFKEVQRLEKFQHLYKNQQILGEKNFVDSSLSIYSKSSHGTKILSLFSCENGSELIGGAPQSNYWLLVSEDAFGEYSLEEFYYVKALEFCDSVGVDVVNASIGYNKFAKSNDSYTVEDLYTKKSISSRASSIAASKGMIIVTSAGNEGNKPWKEVTFPADADSIIAVGATNFKGNAAYYSSYGRLDRGIIRPNFVAPGDHILTLNENGEFSLSYGSSYAAPLICSAIACLWEKYPHVKAYDLIQYLEQTAKDYCQPSLQRGYGFPDLRKLVKRLDAIYLENE